MTVRRTYSQGGRMFAPGGMIVREREPLNLESTNGGETWHNAHLLGGPIRNAWRLWEYEWQVPTKPGKATLMVRATDSEGRTQPTERDMDRRSYVVNHLVPIEVDVW